MKFTCLQENLIKGLSVVTKAVPTKSSLPILSNVLISAKDGRLKLSATNLDTAITACVGASVNREGVITIPAKILHEFVSNLPPSTIEGDLKDNILSLSSEKTKSKFNGTDSLDFPQLPGLPEDTETLKIDPKLFSSAISSVAFCAATDSSRPTLAGILIRYSEGVLTVAAVDGFRLSERTVKIEKGVKPFSVIIPAKILVELSRTFSTSDSPIKVVLNINENLVLFECGNVLVATRIIDGDYPDYRKIIPKDASLTAKFLAEHLLEAVKLTNVFAKEVNSIIKVTFNPKGFIKLSSSSKETGENDTEIEAEVRGDLIEVAYNSKYLLDFLNNVKFDKLVFETNGNLAPGVLKSLDDKDYLHIIMPVRIQR